MADSQSLELARQILARDLSGVNAPTSALITRGAERTFQRLANTLVRWIGPEGCHALFTRALSLAQTQNPALKVVPPPTRSAVFLEGLASAKQHDATAVTEEIVLILTSLFELLARLIGHDLAIRLVAESIPSYPAGVVPSPDAERQS